MEWAEHPELAQGIFVISVTEISRGHTRVEEVQEEEEEMLLVAEEETPLEAEEDLIDHHLAISETEMEVLKINLIHPSDQDLETIPTLILKINVLLL